MMMKTMMTDEELREKLEESTRNAKHHQLETLRSILHHNGSVRYLQSFSHKGDPSDPATFTRVVPLSSYDDYVDYIHQMADGKHDPLLSVDPLLCFFYRCMAPLFIFVFIYFSDVFFFGGFNLIDKKRGLKFCCV